MPNSSSITTTSPCASSAPLTSTSTGLPGGAVELDHRAGFERDEVAHLHAAAAELGDDFHASRRSAAWSGRGRPMAAPCSPSGWNSCSMTLAGPAAPAPRPATVPSGPRPRRGRVRRRSAAAGGGTGAATGGGVASSTTRTITHATTSSFSSIGTITKSPTTRDQQRLGCDLARVVGHGLQVDDRFDRVGGGFAARGPRP